MPVKQISNGTLKQELERAGEKLVLIDFYATWFVSDLYFSSFFFHDEKRV